MRWKSVTLEIGGNREIGGKSVTLYTSHVRRLTFVENERMGALTEHPALAGAKHP
jgi:hypothetical protein